MKCFFAVLLTGILWFPAMVCSQEHDATSGATKKYEAESGKQGNKEDKMSGGKILVVYYSRTGNTKKVAEDLAKRLGADVEEIVDKHKRSGVKGYMLAGRDASKKKLTEIGEIQKDPSKYETVIIGTPVWAWNMTPAVRTYITNYKDKFKQVAYFTTAGGTNPDKIIVSMEELSGKKSVASFGVFDKELKDKNKEKYEQKIADFIKVFQK